MPVEKIWSAYKPVPNFESYVGENREIFFDPNSGDIRISDGVTPGGIPLTFTEIRFDTTHDITGNEPVGSLTWDNEDQTLNLFHPGGVIQQVGQETFGYVRNKTGSTILNGSAVRFSGAEQNGTARLLIAPMIANNTFPNLYIFGIATQDIADGEDGKVTVWGKVRDVNTTGNGENWQVGDILYVSPDTAGALTNSRPTAPNNVIPIAAVLRVDATAGELFVRPSFEQQKNYAEFYNTADQTAAANNTAYAITYNGLGPTQQISVVSNSRITFAETGFYTITLNAQVLSTNASAKDVRFWFKKNGTNLTNTTRVQTLTGNGEYRPFSMSHSVSIEPNDYIELMWATTDTTASLKAAPATAYAPASPSVQVVITQPAL